MIPIYYLFDQEEQNPADIDQDNSLADRIYARALERIPNPVENEEEEIERVVDDNVEKERMNAKIAARTSEELASDTELKKLKAAAAIHSKRASEDISQLEKGEMSDDVQKDEIEKAAEEEQQAKKAAEIEKAAKETVAPQVPEKVEKEAAEQQAAEQQAAEQQAADVKEESTLYDYI